MTTMHCPTSDTSRPWLASLDPEVPCDIDDSPLCLWDLLHNAATEMGRKPFLTFHGARFSFSKVADKAQALAKCLASLGVTAGDRVAIMLPNLPQTVISFFAVQRLGAVAVLLNPLYMEGELSHSLHDATPKAIIVLDRLFAKHETLLRQHVPVQIITRVSDGLAWPKNWLYALKAKKEKHWPDLPKNSPDILSWADALSHGQHSPLPDAAGFDRAAPAILQYTGGTTGKSKGCMLSHRNLVQNVRQCTALLHALSREPQILLGVLPFFHVYGLTVCLLLSAYIKSGLILLPRFDPTETLQAIDRYKPTVFPGTPAMYMTLLSQKNVNNYNMHSIKLCVSGSAPFSKDDLERFESHTGARVVEGYGLTEASPVTHFNPLGKRKIGSIGVPLPSTLASIRSLDGQNRELPVCEAGELYIKGPQVMSGYWQNEQETDGVLRDGWLATGDVAIMDEEGFFFIVDRKKDLIITGGYNVYPREVEEVLSTHPDIKEAAVVGAQHPSRGEVIKAYVVLEPGKKLGRAEVTAFVKNHLANYKAPRLVEFLDELPKTFIGKVSRKTLRENGNGKEPEKS